MTVPASRRRQLLTQINRYAQVDLANLWEAAKDAEDFTSYVVENYPLVADPYHQLAAAMAAGWFELSDPDSTIATLAEPPESDRLDGTAQWALGADGDDGLARLSGSLERVVFDGARDTITQNVRRAGAKWAVEADPDCCDYCQMLASRGAVYWSEETASAGFHDRCRCVAVEVFLD